MATWHQEMAGMQPPGKGYVLRSDGLNKPMTSMGFGNDRDSAFSSLEAHRKNQPELCHFLYKDGNLIA